MTLIPWYTDKQLLANLRALKRKLGHSPRQVDLRHCSPSYKTYWDRFGSLPNALRLARLPLNNFRSYKLTQEQREEIGKLHVVGCHCHADLGNTRELADHYGVTIARICQIGRAARRAREAA